MLVESEAGKGLVRTLACCMVYLLDGAFILLILYRHVVLRVLVDYKAPIVNEYGPGDVEGALDALDEHLATAPLDVDLVSMYTSAAIFDRPACEVEVSHRYLKPYAKMAPPTFCLLTSRPFRTFVKPCFKVAICAALSRRCGYFIEPSVHPDIVCGSTKMLDSQNVNAALLEAGVGDGDVVYYS